jgi:5-formaminoimidazole-4-carboxamide-1-(beta)-D-ribofuranosyl 5'-monophosphate synthetase
MKKYKVGTFGSHSALQILKGAKDEGFGTVAICRTGRSEPYRSYKVADEIIELDDWRDYTKVEPYLIKNNVIMIPHGSFITSFELEELQAMKSLYFGNKDILPWETSRDKQRSWLQQANLTLPKIYTKPEEIDGPVIIKFHGAAGGKGYFLATNTEEFYRKIKPFSDRKYIIQQYIIGAPVYVHYFYSPLNDELEVMGMDKRYETNVDSIGRISAKDQLDLNIESSYNIMGNTAVVVRESMLPDIFNMGRNVVEASKKLESHGLLGPFCLEMVVTPDLEFYVFEISARIVAGVNPYTNGSPYTQLRYKEPMSTGRRVAREIKNAISSGQLEKILVNGHLG